MHSEPKWPVVAEWGRSQGVPVYTVVPSTPPAPSGQWTDEQVGLVYVVGMVWGAVLALAVVWLFYA